MSSSPLPIPSSDDDVAMAIDDELPQTPAAHGGQSMSQAPRADPLFLAGTPSTQASTPLRGVVARRAVGMSSTPRRNRPPLFGPGSSSSPAHFPSSSPAKNAHRTPGGRGSSGAGSNLDSEPLDFPSSPARASTPKNRRGDIHSSLSLTPTRPRTARPRTNNNPDLSSDADRLSLPASSLAPLSAPAQPTEDEPDEIRAIWGTTVNLADTMKAFRDFIKGFKPKYRVAHDRSLGRPTKVASSPAVVEVLLYEGYLRRMRVTGEANLNLDCENLRAFPLSRKLYGQLVKYPQEVVPAMDQVLKDIMLELAEEDQAEGVEGMVGQEGEEEIAEIMSKVYKVRPFGLPAVNMRSLNPQDTDKLVCIKGLVIRATPVIPDMKVAFFRCLTCNHTVQVEIDRGKIDEPAACPRDVCASVGTMSLVHNRCEFADRQVIRLQETPDAVPDGQTPHTVSLSAYDELVDVSKPGDRLVVTGIFRSVPVRVNPRRRTIKSLFKTFLDVVHVRLGQDARLAFDKSTRPAGGDRVPGVGGAGVGEEQNEEEGMVVRKAEMEQKVKELSLHPDIYALLSRSLAPSVWSMDDVKKGILLQLFGGTNKSIARGGGGGGPRYRGDINVLLVGDPGTSKSQILQYVHKLAPRGVYTSGKGSSAVGLTAYVTRDPDSKQLVLESGALVLSDGGVCCIDEFDKMSEATRSVLHEVMEQQTVSIAKAGIITTLNARTSVLAAANPVGSKYDVNLPVTRNIDLPPTLISRFDLLYLVLDEVNETLDRRLAQHLVALYIEDNPETGGEDILPLDQLFAYIDYGRSRVHPQITEEASHELVQSYLKLRNLGDDPRAAEKRITATTRQLESIIRLSEAHARMRLSPHVLLPDVQEAYRLMRDAIRTSALDPTTGKIDMGLLNTGTGQQQRKLREDMQKEVLALLGASASAASRGIRWVDAIQQLANQSSIRVDASEFKEVISAMEAEGLVRVVGERDRRMIRRIDAS
ncbi:MCM2/3/5 family-domain-containing protein [Russula dissimulans]|nr:MCM2/3/5 family-domain-containing protein [Russula dissimulans]